MDKFREMNPIVKKLLGILFVFLGLFALITPLTPGSWLALIGIELLGIRFLFIDKLTAWWKSRHQKGEVQK